MVKSTRLPCSGVLCHGSGEIVVVRCDESSVIRTGPWPRPTEETICVERPYLGERPSGVGEPAAAGSTKTLLGLYSLGAFRATVGSEEERPRRFRRSGSEDQTKSLSRPAA